ncbi:MAG: hypothetical protein QM820_33875 [Minicystis sp.]
MPSLRERRADIPLLIRHFHERFAPSSAEDLSPALIQALREQDWPGNVRELRSAVERLALLGEPMFLADSASAPASGISLRAAIAPPAEPGPAPEDLPDDPALSFRIAKEQAVTRWERAYLCNLMQRARNNLSVAARAAQMDCGYLRNLLRRHGLHVERAAEPQEDEPGGDDCPRHGDSHHHRAPRFVGISSGSRLAHDMD